MDKPKISVLIPYRRRLANVRNAFAALTDQTMNGPDLQVVIGAIEPSSEYAAVTAEFTGRLNIVTVTSGGEWNVSRARNQALPVVAGQVTVSVDVDMVLPPNCLENLYRRYFADGQDVNVLGQMLGYDDALSESDVHHGQVEVPPYEQLLRIWTDQHGRVLGDLGYEGEAGTITVGYKKPAGGELTGIQ